MEEKRQTSKAIFPNEDKFTRYFAMFGTTCPECEEVFERKLKRNPRLVRVDEDMSATVTVDFNDLWVFNLKIDCDSWGDHVVNLQGAWTNPVIKQALILLGVTKKKVKSCSSRVLKKSDDITVPVLIRQMLHKGPEAES